MTKEHYFKNSFFSLPKPLSYMLGSHSQPTHPFISATVGYTTASPCTRQQLSAYPSFYLCHSWLHHSQSLHQAATISLPILLSLPQLVTPQPVPAPDSNYQPTHPYICATVGYATASPCTRQPLWTSPSLLSLPQLVTPQPVPAPGGHYQPTHLYTSATLITSQPVPAPGGNYQPTHLCHSWLHHSQSLHQQATTPQPLLHAPTEKPIIFS